MRPSARNRLALVALLAVALAALEIQPQGGTPLHAAVGIPLVLLLPGMPVSITFLAFMKPLERLALTLATSISVAALSFLALDVVEIGLDADTFTFALAGATLLMCLIAALVPSRQLVAEPRVSVEGKGSRVLWGLVALALVAAAGVVTGLSVASRNDDDDFTELWALPTGSEVAPSAILGVRNQTGQGQTYVARLKRDGRQFATWGPFQLDPGESITETQNLDARTGQLQVVLKSDETEPEVRTATLNFR